MSKIIANTNNKIIVTSKFFEDFGENEQKALIYHEQYHQKILTLLKRIFLEFRARKKQDGLRNSLQTDMPLKSVVKRQF